MPELFSEAKRAVDRGIGLRPHGIGFPGAAPLRRLLYDEQPCPASQTLHLSRRLRGRVKTFSRCATSAISLLIQSSPNSSLTVAFMQ